MPTVKIMSITVIITFMPRCATSSRFSARYRARIEVTVTPTEPAASM